LEELGVVCCIIYSRNSISARAVLSSRPSSRPSWRGCRRCAAAAAAKDAAETALHRFNNFAKRFNAATRHGQDEVSPALLDMLHDERLALRASNGTAMKARRVLENAEWRASCLRSDVEQIDLLQNPPPVEHRPDVVKRQPPEVADNYDTIILPVRAA
jgi:hypothetical protein